MLISQYCRCLKANKFSAFPSHFCGNVNCQSTSAHLNIQAKRTWCSQSAPYSHCTGSCSACSRMCRCCLWQKRRQRSCRENTFIPLQLFASWTEVHIQVSPGRAFQNVADLCMWMKQEGNHCVSLIKCMSVSCSHIRSQLGAVDQVLQRVAAAEFVYQTGQVADEGRRVRGVYISWHIPDLNQRHVPIGVGPIGRADLRQKKHLSSALL